MEIIFATSVPNIKTISISHDPWKLFNHIRLCSFREQYKSTILINYTDINKTIFQEVSNIIPAALTSCQRNHRNSNCRHTERPKYPQSRFAQSRPDSTGSRNLVVPRIRAPPATMRKAFVETRKSRRCGRRGVQRKRRCKPHLRKLVQGGARRKSIRGVVRDWRLCSPAWTRCPCRSAPGTPRPSPTSGQKANPPPSSPRRERNLLMHLHDVRNHLASHHFALA